MKSDPEIREWPFEFAIFACVQFIVLTVVAMLAYPGGATAGPTMGRYSFFTNFFSTLGLTETSGGEPNTVSMILFVVALTTAGMGMIAFFMAMPRFFRHRRGVYALSWLGSLFGVMSGMSYIGVAFTPANLLLGLHTNFVLLAFRAFLVVVAVYAVVIFISPEYPNRFAGVFLVFALMLAGYIWLLTRGPGLDTQEGLIIQATGQKLIVYAAILCTLVQSYGALLQKRVGKGSLKSGVTS
jgi:hypothetical protein